MAINTELRSALELFNQNHRVEWLETRGAIMGKSDGSLATGTAGVYWARSTNGQDIEVLANGVPVKFDLHVLIGRSIFSPTLWQIVKSRESYADPINGSSVQYHADQHGFYGPDRVYIDRRQVLQLSVLAVSGWTVRLYGGTLRTSQAAHSMISNVDIDLSAYPVTSGAKFIAIESDTAGVISINAGTAFSAPEAATPANLPLPATGKYTRAWVLFYESQTAIADKDIYVPPPPDFNPTDWSLATHNHDTRYPKKWTGKVSAPGVTDDSAAGYIVADIWLDETHNKAYIALSVTVGAASWQEVGAGGLADAPSDGQLYGRKDAAWEVVTGTGGTPIAYDDLTSQVPAVGDHFDLAAAADDVVLLIYNSTVQSMATFTMDGDNLGLTTSFSPVSGDTLIAVYSMTGSLVQISKPATLRVYMSRNFSL